MPPSSAQSGPWPSNRPVNGARFSVGSTTPLKRSFTPNPNDDRSATGSQADDREANTVSERRKAHMKDLYARAERVVDRMYGRAPASPPPTSTPSASQNRPVGQAPGSQGQMSNEKKRPARVIDEDDYDLDDDEDDEPIPTTQPLKPTTSTPNQTPTKPPLPSSLPNKKPRLDRGTTTSSGELLGSSEEARKKLDEDKRLAEARAKESFLTSFYTLEDDRDAMLEQQRLEELDRQVETEVTGAASSNDRSKHALSQAQNSLSSTNLGVSSLTFRHLISHVDIHRDKVPASNAELKKLMSEVRKGRGPHASEDRIGQEELYEPADKVLQELKGMTEWITPFLTRVKQKDAPDYYKVITEPMDIGTMLKKIKQHQYRSKAQFVHDLDRIWENCLFYNDQPQHPLRKKAEHLKREAERLKPLIPDIVVRDRADVEAEERAEREREEREERTANVGEAEDSDDDQPIVASRGRKAPGKTGMKGTGQARKAPSAPTRPSPAVDQRPSSAGDGPVGLQNEHLKVNGEGSSRNGVSSTPPPGNSTPSGPNGIAESAAADSNVDLNEIDASASHTAFEQQEDLDEEDEDYKIWKQVTKKDRARVTAQRHQLFDGTSINPDAPALLRTKAGMRRTMKQHKLLLGDDAEDDDAVEEHNQSGPESARGATLAEGIDDADNDLTLPDYYDPVAGVPLLESRLRWTEDAEGNVIDRRVECLRKYPDGQFVAPKSRLTSTMDDNMRQMQETRKLMSKIGVVKQMQLQAQTYQNQFQKYDPEPFVEKDIDPTVVSDDGPIITPGVCRAGLQRSVGKIFYHAGFEEFQPSALEAVTDIAATYLQNIAKTYNIYREAPKVCEEVDEATTSVPSGGKKRKKVLKPRFTPEETVLHALHENGTDLESLRTYVEEDIPRLSSKLAAHHKNVKEHLTELLRPALEPGAAAGDGAQAFADNSEAQFVAGEFADDIGEDFFGFKALGLDKEFGLANMSVPLHLLQSRMNNAYQPANAVVAGTGTGNVMENPPAWDPITQDNVDSQVGLVQSFFREKLEKTNGQPLVEDDELPAKQRFPKPRLPPSGKISSPRKRPPREQQMMQRKKRRMEIEAERERERQAQNEANNAQGTGQGGSSTVGFSTVEPDSFVAGPAGMGDTSSHEPNVTLGDGTSQAAPPADDNNDAAAATSTDTNMSISLDDTINDSAFGPPLSPSAIADTSTAAENDDTTTAHLTNGIAATDHAPDSSLPSGISNPPTGRLRLDATTTSANTDGDADADGEGHPGKKDPSSAKAVAAH
ncbi:MAG: Transcriptional activator spt7 [Alyxoria varia]|nr:MAG: Transcriptional activator spt7 [Alyxoria varia]